MSYATTGALGLHAYTDGPDLIANLPYWDGHCQDPAQIHEFIKKSHAKIMPGEIREKSVAFNSGLIAVDTDNIPVKNDICHGDLGDPTAYKCAPADNCTDELLDITKTVIQKSLTASKSLCIDPFCDEDIAMEIYKAGGVLKFSVLKMQQIAYAFSKFENRTAYTAIAAETGYPITATITTWDEDNAVPELDCVLADVADTLRLDMSDLMIFTSHVGKRPIETAGKLIDNSTARSEMKDGFFNWNNGYVGDYSGVPWYADGGFPSNKIYIGVPGAMRFWDSPMTYSIKEVNCNHGMTHLWSKKYTLYVPCDMKNKFVVLDLPAGCAPPQ